MALRSSEDVKCGCGHIGSIMLVENDSPYSACYEHYSLHGLAGNGAKFTVMTDWPEVFAAMKPRCPQCNAKLAPDNLLKQPSVRPR